MNHYILAVRSNIEHFHITHVRQFGSKSYWLRLALPCQVPWFFIVITKMRLSCQRILSSMIRVNILKRIDILFVKWLKLAKLKLSIPSNDNLGHMLTKALGMIMFKQGWTWFNMMSLEKAEFFFWFVSTKVVLRIVLLCCCHNYPLCLVLVEIRKLWARGGVEG
jgi:hypothetical protein